jgi:hypothetical protein
VSTYNVRCLVTLSDELNFLAHQIIAYWDSEAPGDHPIAGLNIFSLGLHFLAPSDYKPIGEGSQRGGVGIYRLHTQNDRVLIKSPLLLDFEADVNFTISWEPNRSGPDSCLRIYGFWNEQHIPLLARTP